MSLSLTYLSVAATAVVLKIRLRGESKRWYRTETLVELIDKRLHRICRICGTIFWALMGLLVLASFSYLLWQVPWVEIHVWLNEPLSYP